MVKVMNYVYAAGIYVIFNAALYASNYMEGASVHGSVLRPDTGGFTYAQTAPASLKHLGQPRVDLSVQTIPYRRTQRDY